MLYINARFYGKDYSFHEGAFEVIGGRFGKICCRTENMDDEEYAAHVDAMKKNADPAQVIDLEGATVIPGLIDLHTHGNSGADFSDGDYEGLVKMAEFYAANGVTSFLPTSMTLPYGDLQKAFANAVKLRKVQQAPEEKKDRVPETDEAEIKIGGTSRLLGIHMEGPYFSYKKRGAQNPAYLKEPDIEGFKKLYEECDGLISIVDTAPELPGAEDFAREISAITRVSAAHTDTDYAHAKAFFDAGAAHLTHLFNAMPGIHHREPGVIPAAAENEAVMAEIICDGYHVHPASVRLAFSLFGAERMILISDSGRCAGMPEGSSFTLGGQEARLENGVGRLPDGTIACSAANLWDCMVNVMRWGIREEDAVRAAACNPAKAAGADKEVGSIMTGKRADFVVTDRAYSTKTVFIDGIKIG